MELIGPRYGAASLADVMPSALATLGVPGSADPLGLAEGALAGVRRIAILLIDGLGNELLPRAAPVAPVIADVLAGRLGQRLVLTAPFPSTTPTSLVSLGTGVPPGQHGVLGFTLAIPGTPDRLNHVLWRDEPDPNSWQPVPTQFTRAAAAGVRVSVVSKPDFAGSGLTVAAYRGADYRGADGVDALAAEVLAALDAPDRNAGGPPGDARHLVYGYFPDVDLAGHLYGVGSPPWLAAVQEVDRLIDRIVDGLPADAALLVTADHGMLDVPEDARVDLDTVPELRAGLRLVAGEPRVRYLHTLPGARSDVLAAWRSMFGPRAWVGTREEVLDNGWFGPVSAGHLDRIGDVVVVCLDRGAVLASASEPVNLARLVAYHGSLTRIEMAIPLLVFRGCVGPAG